MRRHTAVQVNLPEGAGWRYASLGGRGGHPIGYCAEHPPHPTEAEARACYRRYERDHVTLDAQFGGWAGCQHPGCDTPTKTGADARDGYRAAPLCDTHLTLDAAYTALDLDGPTADDCWIF